LLLTVKIIFIYFLSLFCVLVVKEIITVRLNNRRLSNHAKKDSGEVPHF